MPLSVRRPEVVFSIRIVRQAARLVQQIQAELVSPALTKDDRSPVTVADFASQAGVAQALEQAFPDDPLIGEENANALRTPEEAMRLEQVTGYVRRLAPGATPARVCGWIDRGCAGFARRSWVLDPIDGTKGFLRGGQYAVALALLVDGQVQIGVLGCPNLRDSCVEEMHGPGSLVAAVRGEGAWVSSLDEQDMHFTRLHVSNCQDPAQARLLRSFEAGHTNVEKIDALAQRLGIHTEAVRMDSQAKYAILAAGGGEASVRLLSPEHPNYKEKIWDQAAGALIVEEAGGRISDLAGKPFDFSAGRQLLHNRGVLCSNGLLHPAILQALAEVGA
jgi:3'(2'), 5'-bisphosphate nucleotidase